MNAKQQLAEIRARGLTPDYVAELGTKAVRIVEMADDPSVTSYQTIGDRLDVGRERARQLCDIVLKRTEPCTHPKDRAHLRIVRGLVHPDTPA